MVGTSRGENTGRIWVHWLMQCSSTTLGRPNRMLNKPIERIGRIVLSPLADRVYICDKIKINYRCGMGQEWSNNSSVWVGGQERHKNELHGQIQATLV